MNAGKPRLRQAQTGEQLGKGPLVQAKNLGRGKAGHAGEGRTDVFDQMLAIKRHKTIRAERKNGFKLRTVFTDQGLGGLARRDVDAVAHNETTGCA